MEIKYVEKLNDELGKMIDDEFEKYARKHGVVCGYKPFTFIAEEDGKTIGIITGCTYYKEVHIGDLIIVEEYRNRHIGSKLIETVEKHFKGKGFENMNLTTYDFQAPEFYKKCGFEVEHIRECKENSKLNKYLLVKYF